MTGGNRSAPSHRKTGLSWLSLTAVILVIAGIGSVAFYFLGRGKGVPTVNVERGTIVRAFYATGVVRPNYEYILKSKAQGALQEFTLREGDSVKKGQRIGRVDDKQLKYEAERYTAELREAKKQAADDAPQREEVVARLNEAKSQLGLAKENLDRTQKSFDSKAANYTDLDAARRSYVQWANTAAALESQLGTWRIASQRAVEVAEANLRKAEANLADAEILSPIDGILLERYVENQEVVGVNQKIVFVAAPNDKLMKASVDEEDVTRTHVGQHVDMQLYAFQDRDGLGGARILQGKVIDILPSANPVNKTYEVKIEFIEPPPELKVGMTGELNFIEEASVKNDALLVPSSAILDRKVYRPHSANGLAGYEAVPVKIGIRTLDKVQILEGLSEGETIVADAKQVAPVKLPAQKPPVVPTRTGDNVAEK
jgi:HlyD family secretion protein